MKSFRDINLRRTLISLMSNQVFIKYIFSPSTTAQYKQQCMMQTHLKGQLYTLSHVIPTLRVPTAASFSNRHYPQGLDCRQGVVIRLLVKEPLRLLEEVVA